MKRKAGTDAGALVRFEIHRASNTREPEPQPVASATWDADARSWVVELVTLEDFLALLDASGHDLVVGRRSITIYDDYME